jgi:hypothetical protein
MVAILQPILQYVFFSSLRVLQLTLLAAEDRTVFAIPGSQTTSPQPSTSRQIDQPAPNVPQTWRLRKHQPKRKAPESSSSDERSTTPPLDDDSDEEELLPPHRDSLDNHPYELARQANIARNKALLLELGLGDPMKELVDGRLEKQQKDVPVVNAVRRQSSRLSQPLPIPPQTGAEDTPIPTPTAAPLIPIPMSRLTSEDAPIPVPSSIPPLPPQLATHVTLNPLYPPAPEAPTTSAAVVPVHPPTTPVTEPDWFTAATKQLQSASDSEEWSRLVATWIEFEQRRFGLPPKVRIRFSQPSNLTTNETLL